MINLSETARENPNYPLLYKIKYFRYPDVYLAESVKDFKENAPCIKLPLYKRCFDRAFDHVLITLVNVGIERKFFNWFAIHDLTGKEIMFLENQDHFLGTPYSYEKVKENQGLKEKDWVYDVAFRYFFKNDLPTIIQVNKYKFSNRKPEKDSVADMVKNFLPGYTPLPVPSF